MYVPLNPHSDLNEVQRYYASLSLDVTYLWDGILKSKLALEEYIGKFRGFSAHGNAKSGDEEYIRTWTVGRDLKTDKPSMVYSNLQRNPNVTGHDGL